MAIRKKNGWNEEDTRLTNKMRKKGPMRSRHEQRDEECNKQRHGR